MPIPGECTRIVIAWLISALVFALPGARYAVADAVEVKRQPNILLVMTDDQHYDTVRYMPQLMERLVPGAVGFSRAYVTTPNCCPARAGFYSGRYNHGHGVLTNSGKYGGALRYAADVDVAEELNRVGYRTGIFGKWFTQYQGYRIPQPRGFESWLVFDDFPGPDKPERKPGWQSYHHYYNWNAVSPDGPAFFADKPEDYSTDVLLRHALEFLDARDDRPFFLLFTPFAPHFPAVAAERHKSIDRDEIELIRSPAFGKQPENTRWGEELTRRQWQDRIRSIEQRTRRQIISLLPVDEAVAALLDALKKQKQLDNTVVIFTSDNGYAVGEHRWNNKLCPYDVCMRVPLLIQVPDGVLNANMVPGRNTGLVTNLDVARTILELAGSPAAASAADGVSLLPALVNKAVNTRDEFFVEFYGTGGRLPRGLMPWQGIRTRTRKLVIFSDDSVEYFNLEQDPWELRNVADDSAYAEEIKALTKRVHKRLKFRINRRMLAFRPADGVCDSASGDLLFEFPGSIDEQPGHRFVSAAIELKVPYSFIDSPPESLILNLRSARQRKWFALGGARAEVNRKRATLDVVLHLPERIQPLFGQSGVELRVRHTSPVILKAICADSPRLRVDIVSDL